MSLYHIFRSQTGTFAPSTTGWFSYYVNASGQLLCQANNGDVFSPSSSYALTGAREAVTTGNVIFNDVTTVTGHVYGGTGTYLYPTLLGEPNFWVSALGPQGQLLAVPAYTRSS